MAAAKGERTGRVLFPKSGFTTDDAVAYYRAVSRQLLPHLRDRPLSFKRYPDTVEDESFWEKDAPSFTPAWVKRVPVPRRDGSSDIDYVVAGDSRTLAWLASIGGIELHPFLHRTGALDRPTEVVFDLDPGSGATILDCCRVALLLRDALEERSLRSFVKVSGSKGIQVYVPLDVTFTHDQTETFARLLAEDLARRHPRLIVARMAKALRAKRVFIDWSQNAAHKTTVAPYSLRATRAEPFVSLPTSWAEIANARRRSDLDFTPNDAVARVQASGDAWRTLRRHKQRLAGVLPARAATAPQSRIPRRARQGTRLPVPGSQSGRRLFVLPRTEMGDELWLDVSGRFRRWILRPDRTGGQRLIAMPAGQFPIDPEYFRGEVPAAWRARVSLQDLGSYEIVEGSFRRQHARLFFTGRVLAGEWVLEKLTPDARHRSWVLAPAR